LVRLSRPPGLRSSCTSIRLRFDPGAQPVGAERALALGRQVDEFEIFVENVKRAQE